MTDYQPIVDKVMAAMSGTFAQASALNLIAWVTANGVAWLEPQPGDGQPPR